MEPFKSTHEVLGPSFQGVAIRVNVDDVDAFFNENRSRFEKSGSRALLRAMKIPASFFELQPQKVRDDILVAQKVNIRKKTKTILFLSNPDGKIVSAAPESTLGWKDPAEVLGFADNTWRPGPPDYERAMFSYTSSIGAVAQYRPQIHLMVPLFHSAPLVMDVYLFNTDTESFVVDNQNSTSIRLIESQLSKGFFPVVVSALQNAISTHTTEYDQFLAYLQGRAETMDTTLAHIGAMIEGGKISKTLLMKAVKHLDLIKDAKDVADEEEGAPTELNNRWDVMHLLAVLNKSAGSISGAKSTGSRLFQYFYDQYRVDTGAKKFKIDVGGDLAAKEAADKAALLPSTSEGAASPDDSAPLI